MPIRNLSILALMTVFCLACAIQARNARYGGMIGHAIRLIEDNFVDPVDPQDLFESAMKAVAKDLDEHSEYIPAQRYKEFHSMIEQKFGGIGIQIEGPPSVPQLTVVAPIPETPAFVAGIQAGDTILEIDGQSTEGLSSSDSLELMRGEVGTSVELLVQRMDSSERIRLKMTRANIEVGSVYGDRIRADSTWDFFLEEDPRIAYIRVAMFGERTKQEFKAALEQVRSKAKALVIDLRFNPGGIMPASVDMCDMLVDEGVIVRTIGRNPLYNTNLQAKSNLLLDLKIPLFVLINGESASASEIMAGCLQDLGRAKIAGSRSYGKGTVQQIFEMGGNRNALKFTTARFHRPSYKNIHRLPEMTEADQWGIRPDRELEFPLSDLQQIYLNRRWHYRGDPRHMGRAERAPEPPFAADPQLELLVSYIQRNAFGESNSYIESILAQVDLQAATESFSEGSASDSAGQSASDRSGLVVGSDNQLPKGQKPNENSPQTTPMDTAP